MVLDSLFSIAADVESDASSGSLCSHDQNTMITSGLLKRVNAFIKYDRVFNIGSQAHKWKCNPLLKRNRSNKFCYRKM